MKSSACPRLPSIFSAAGNIWTCCRWLTNFQKRLCPMAILAIGGSPYSFSSIYKPYNFPFRVASAACSDLGGFSTSPSLSSISREDESAAYSGIETALDSVVKIFTVSSSPNYLLPWQNKPPHETWGSGFAVPGKRIITSAHVVADHTFIQVRKPCSPTECRGHALSVGHECDLAILGWTVKNSGRARVFSSLEAFRSYKMK